MERPYKFYALEHKERFLKTPFAEEFLKGAKRLGYIAFGSGVLSCAGIAGMAYLVYQDFKEQKSDESRTERFAKYAFAISTSLLSIASTVAAIANRNRIKKLVVPAS